MGCNTSSPLKDITLLSPSKTNRVTDVIKNGKQKVQNSVNEMANDVAQMDFQKAQQDLQQVGVGLENTLNEGMNELMNNGVDAKSSSDTNTEMEKGEDENDGGSVTLSVSSPTSTVTPALVEEMISENYTNTPIPLDMMDDEVTEEMITKDNDGSA